MQPWRYKVSDILSALLLYKNQSLLPVSARFGDTTNTHSTAMSDCEVSTHNLERGAASETLYNSTIKDLSWHGITVTVSDRKKKAPKQLLDDVNGEVKAGEKYQTFH